jgi:hypothetical protein
MKRRGSDHDSELDAFLEPRKIQRHAPPELRARVLARARATLAGDVVLPPGPVEAPMPRARGRRLLAIALAASVAMAAGAVGAVAALQGRRTPAPAPAAAPPAAKVPITNVRRPSSEPPTPEMDGTAPARRLHPARPAAKGDAFTVELELLQRAHAAYTRRDFSAALTLIAEHARRFPKSHLAEQREALRVRSLAGAGRVDEAQRAAATFAVRFPRSVLLPRVEGASESPQR